jgi:hypothetical protein
MKKLLTLLLLTVVLVSNAQESTLLRLNYKKGDQYLMTMDLSQGMGVNGGMDMKMIASVNITEVNGDTYTNEMKFTKMVVDALAGGQNMSFDSDMSDDELDDSGKMLKAQMGPILGAVISTKGNNLGEVLEVTVEPNIPGADDMAKQNNNIVYPKEAVKVGSTWSLEKEQQGMKMNFVYTVKSISKSLVILSVSGTVSGMAEGTITGAMNIDKNSGVLLKSSIDTKMSVGGQEMTTKVNAVMKKI